MNKTILISTAALLLGVSNLSASMLKPPPAYEESDAPTNAATSSKPLIEVRDLIKAFNNIAGDRKISTEEVKFIDKKLEAQKLKDSFRAMQEYLEGRLSEDQRILERDLRALKEKHETVQDRIIEANDKGTNPKVEDLEKDKRFKNAAEAINAKIDTFRDKKSSLIKDLTKAYHKILTGKLASEEDYLSYFEKRLSELQKLAFDKTAEIDKAEGDSAGAPGGPATPGLTELEAERDKAMQDASSLNGSINSQKVLIERIKKELDTLKYVR